MKKRCLVFEEEQMRELEPGVNLLEHFELTARRSNNARAYRCTHIPTFGDFCDDHKSSLVSKQTFIRTYRELNIINTIESPDSTFRSLDVHLRSINYHVNFG